MRHIETSDDRGFEEPRAMRDEATRYEQGWRDKYDDLSRAQCHERLAAADARSDLDTLRRAAFAAAVALGAKLPDDAGPETIATALRQGVESVRAEMRAVDEALEAVGIPNGGRSLADRIRDPEDTLAGDEHLAMFHAMTPLRLEANEIVMGDETDPRDAVNERIAKLPREQRHEAMRRASCSYSAPRSAVRDGARIEGNEVVWPDGERYPMAPWNEERITIEAKYTRVED